MSGVCAYLPILHLMATAAAQRAAARSGSCAARWMSTGLPKLQAGHRGRGPLALDASHRSWGCPDLAGLELGAG